MTDTFDPNVAIAQHTFDPNGTTAQTTTVPSIAERLIQAAADKAATAAATVLIGAGLLAPTGEAQFAAVAGGIIVAGANLAWTWIVAHRHDIRLRTAVSAPASLPVTK